MNQVNQFVHKLFRFEMGHSLRLEQIHGVLHVTAVARRYGFSKELNLHTILLNDLSPKCEFDFFMLNLSRALSSHIISSGKTLRAEPNAHFQLVDVFQQPLRAMHTRALENCSLSTPVAGQAVVMTMSGMSFDDQRMQDTPDFTTKAW